MSNLKEILFAQLASDGLTNLVEELQNKYKPKKGRRFHHNNITYEISRPGIKENFIEFEISSKIPEDELDSSKDMKSYFQEIKKIVTKGKEKPVSIEMENIVWDSKKDTEKEREYVKLLYQYPLDDLYDNKEVISRFKKIKATSDLSSLPHIPGAYTLQGKLVLAMVKEKIMGLARDNITNLVNANKEVKAAMGS